MRNPKRQVDECPYIPPELMRLVMARLPVKSLCRFKCVSAWWNSTISNPQFEELQFDSSAPSLLISAYGDNGFTTFFLKQKQKKQPVPVHMHVVKSFEIPSLSESVGGLVLDDSKQHELRLRIYNPSTGELSGDIRVPCYADDGMIFKGSMFGYDPIHRTHKILARWADSADSSLTVKAARYRVLTLDKQMKWRSLAGGSGDTHEPIYSALDRIYLDGVVYCIGFPIDETEVCFFGGFDFKSEVVLRWVRGPPAIAGSCFSIRIMGFNGRVALYYSGLNDTSPLEEDDEIVMWLFQGFDEEDPWRRITIAKPPVWKRVNFHQVMMGTVPSGELLFWDTEYNTDSVFPITLFYYNIDSKIIRTEYVLPEAAETDTLYDEYPEAFVTNHMESIKSLKYISN